jgi:hypothetical protein
MASTKLTLSEKGFGTSKKGASTILADTEGKPLTLRLVTLPNGHTGGQSILVPINQIRENKKSFINTSTEVFEIKLNHQQNVGTVTVRHFDCENLNYDVYEAGIVLENSFCRILSSHGMNKSERAKELLEGILWDAYQAALTRAFDPNPDKIYFGKLAMDGGFTKLEYFDKKPKSAKV